MNKQNALRTLNATQLTEVQGGRFVWGDPIVTDPTLPLIELRPLPEIHQP